MEITRTILFAMLFAGASLVATGQIGEICDNGIDDDGDGLVDLNDKDECSCVHDPFVQPTTSPIPNPSFELNSGLPDRKDQFNLVNDWYLAYNETPDYYCGFEPDDYLAASWPFPSGTCASGLMVAFTNGFRKTEYIGTYLVNPLPAGSSAKLEFYVYTTWDPISSMFPGSMCSGVANVAGLPPYQFSLYGYNNQDPFGSMSVPDCPAGTELGSVSVTPMESWQKISLVMNNIPHDIQKIVIGASCQVPAEYVSGCYAYSLIDGLNMKVGAVPINLTIHESGGLCAGDSKLQALSDVAGTFQWYKEGIALIGQTSDELLVSDGKYGPGRYTVYFQSNGQCDTASIHVTGSMRPGADFSNSVGCSGQEVQFTNTTNSFSIPYNSEWHFNGNWVVDSRAESPTHTFNTPGTYPVTLVINTPGCSDTIKKTVKINQTPIVRFKPDSGCLGRDFIFQSTPIQHPTGHNYSWDFGDGNTVTGKTNPIHEYALVGKFGVTYTITNMVSKCTDKFVDTAVVYHRPDARILPNQDWIICQKDTLKLYDGSVIPKVVDNDYINYWRWDIDGSSVSYQKNPKWFNVTNGSKVRLIVNTAQGCRDTTVKKEVTVNPNPQTRITASDSCMNQTTVFTDSSGIVGNEQLTYEWDFGDGSSKEQGKGPKSHKYQQPGLYNVRLTVNSARNCSTKAQLPVRIWDKPTAKFTYSDSCASRNVQFSGTSTNPNSDQSLEWLWQLNAPNSNFLSSGYQTDTTYSVAGSYDVTLVVKDSVGCSDTIAKVVDINPTPLASVSVDSGCVYKEFAFNNNSVLDPAINPTHEWDFGDGSKGNKETENHNYNAAGVYTYQYVVASQFGCSDTATGLLKVYDKPNARILGDTVICDYDVLNLSDGSLIPTVVGNDSIFERFWRFGPGPDQLGKNPTWSNVADSSVVRLEVMTQQKCQDTAYRMILVNSIRAHITSMQDGDSVCSKRVVQFNSLATRDTAGGIDYAWDFGDGNGSVVQNPRHPYTQSGKYPVRLIATANNCSDTAMVDSVVVRGTPNAKIQIDGLTCKDRKVVLHNVSDVSSAWPDSLVHGVWVYGNTIDSSQSLSIDPLSDTTTILLGVRSALGCPDTAKRVLIPNPIPKAYFDFVGDSGCAKSCAVFTNQSTIDASATIDSLRWDFDGLGTSTDSVARFCYPNGLPDTVLKYDVTLTVTSDSGCVHSRKISDAITVLPTPNVKAYVIGEPKFCVDSVFRFASEVFPTSKLQWFANKDSLIGEYQDSLTYRIRQDGFLLIELKATNNHNCSEIAQVYVEAVHCYDSIFLPNVFTPNGDEVNDLFEIVKLPPGDHEMSIFNRWGELVYHTSGHPIKGWDGYSASGQEMPVGTYFVVFKVDNHKTYKGNVTLLRQKRN